MVNNGPLALVEFFVNFNPPDGDGFRVSSDVFRTAAGALLDEGVVLPVGETACAGPIPALVQGSRPGYSSVIFGDATWGIGMEGFDLFPETPIALNQTRYTNATGPSMDNSTFTMSFFSADCGVCP